MPESSQGQAFGGGNDGRDDCKASDNRHHSVYDPPLPSTNHYFSVLK
jgi:hypothetical protein